MSPEIILSSLARLNQLLQGRYEAQLKKQKKFKQMQMMLMVLSVSISLVLFVIYAPSVIQMLFILFGFNLLFFIGFKPRSTYSEKKVKVLMQKVINLQVNLKKFMMEEEASFDGVKCSLEEGWLCDKWGLYKDDERIDYATFLYEKNIKGLYLEALRNKK